jgi:hypothetical protein
VQLLEPGQGFGQDLGLDLRGQFFDVDGHEL